MVIAFITIKRDGPRILTNPQAVFVHPGYVWGFVDTALRHIHAKEQFLFRAPTGPYGTAGCGDFDAVRVNGLFLALPEPAYLPVLAVFALPARIGKEHFLTNAVIHFFAEMKEALMISIRA